VELVTWDHPRSACGGRWMGGRAGRDRHPSF
jgi:hypothetical protein